MDADEERAKTLLEEIEWIKEELHKPNSVLHKIYASKTPKKDLILHWAYKIDGLHTLGKWNYNLTDVSTQIKNDMRSLNLESAIPYVHEALPYKYKNPSMMSRAGEDYGSEVHPRLDGSTEIKPFEANKNYITIVDNTIDVFKQLKKALEKKMVIEPHIPKDEWAEFQLRWTYAINRLREILDGREKVPPTTMHLLIYAKSQATLSDTYSHYVRFRKEEAELTPKQSGKILKGRVKKMTLLFEPKNQREALSSGFYGQQCEECGSYRTERKYNSNVDKFRLYCYSCFEWTKVKTERIKVRD